ncbi:MAG: hypothetical protein U1F34_05205 [Gammaproteobacteria bacterium]
MNTAGKIITQAKPFVFIAALIPLVHLIYRGYVGQLGANPSKPSNIPPAIGVCISY